MESEKVSRIPVGPPDPVLLLRFDPRYVPNFAPRATNDLIYDNERFEYIHAHIWRQTILPGYETLVAPEIVFQEV